MPAFAGMDESGQLLQQLAADFIASGIAGTALERTIEWVDTDAAGHHHNSAILRFVEAAEAKLFREAGAESYFSISPRVRHEVDYRAKLYFGQAVTIAIRVEKVGASSMSFGFKVWGHAHQGRGFALAAEGRFVTVCVPVGGESSAPWPREILAGIDAGS
ncbi:MULTISPECIES: thioesterase family protein [Micrococcaceae]|uniref:acyl-CoA thioesterase n=1 Tax=Micrococcaceae TaxID=1268 RepID=UPI00256FFDD3|nr:thioesterase family protein [Arthrobacter sp. MYb222]